MLGLEPINRSGDEREPGAVEDRSDVTAKMSKALSSIEQRRT
jgi:hypothetical protein